jgi:phosphoserine phosphatase
MQVSEPDRQSDVALFLDVDLTLTRRHVQAVYAVSLNCFDGYCALERSLEHNTIDVHQFGQGLVDLFASRRFTRARAAEYYRRVEMRSRASLLLSHEADVFLVSSGPSYFVERLADEFDIPRTRVLCSSYEFCNDTGLISTCSAVTSAEKVHFVRTHAPYYRASIGIGDCPRADGPFLEECTIGLLVDGAGRKSPRDLNGRPAGFSARFADAWQQVRPGPRSRPSGDTRPRPADAPFWAYGAPDARVEGSPTRVRRGFAASRGLEDGPGGGSFRDSELLNQKDP